MHACQIKPRALGDQKPLKTLMRLEKCLPGGCMNQEGAQKFKAAKIGERSVPRLYNFVIDATAVIEPEVNKVGVKSRQCQESGRY
jgi:hypothetical protein